MINNTLLSSSFTKEFVIRMVSIKIMLAKISHKRDLRRFLQTGKIYIYLHLAVIYVCKYLLIFDLRKISTFIYNPLSFIEKTALDGF